MRLNAAAIHALGFAFLVGMAAWLSTSAAENGAMGQDGPFLSRNTIAEFLQAAPARLEGMARVQGTVVYQENRSIVIQDSTAGLLVEMGVAKPLQLGTTVEVLGTITRGVSSPILQNATVRPLRTGPPPAPLAVAADRILAGGYDLRLVTLRGQVLGHEQRGSSFLLRMGSSQIGFQAHLVYPFPGDPLAYIKPGSLLGMTGVCAMQRDGAGVVRSFELMLRTPRDVVVLRGPTWWTAERAAWVGGSILVLSLTVVAWSIALRWRLSGQTERIRSELQQEARHAYENLEERVQERTAQLQTANRELEAFAYTISHDLRAPLRAVEGFASLVQNELRPAQQPPEVKHALEVIRGSALRMSQLIEDLLEFARLGRIEPTATEVNMESLVWSAYEELKVQIGTRTVEFEVQRLAPVYADSGMMRQLVTNLLSNAIKYTRARDVARIEVGTLQEGPERAYFVRDNGVGFDMRYASKLFGVFHRLHTDKRFEGTGVGLAIAHRILERHHGRIWVQSEIDQGTTFYFTVGKLRVEAEPVTPVQDAQHAALHCSDDSPARPGPFTNSSRLA